MTDAKIDLLSKRALRMLCWLLAGTALFGPAVVVAQHAGHAAHGDEAKALRRPPARLATGVTFSPSGELWVAGLSEKGQLFVQASRDLGGSWGPRRVLDTQGDPVAAEGESHPKIAFGRNGQLVIAYTRPLAKPYTGEIRMIRSEDGGRTYSAPFTVHDDRQVITHRFESVLFDRDGALNVLWVDKRDAELARAKEGGKRNAYDGAAIYGKVSRDGGRSFGPDQKLADFSCECCRIALINTPGAGPVAMWRHVFPGSIRDHAFAPIASLGKGHSPVRATSDGWKTGACPHHGPGLANAAGGGFHAVWFGMRGNEMAVRYGRLAKDGSATGVPRNLPDEMAEHADVAAFGQRVAVVWRSFDGERTRVKAWLSVDDGASFSLRELLSSAEDNDYPRLAAFGADHVVVWRTLGGLHVRKLNW